MPQASKRTRRERRVKRQNTLLHRTVQAVRLDNLKHFEVLLTVLSQAGGEVTVTRGTADQVHENLGSLSYAVVKGAAEGELIVRVTQ